MRFFTFDCPRQDITPFAFFQGAKIGENVSDSGVKYLTIEEDEAKRVVLPFNINRSLGELPCRIFGNFLAEIIENCEEEIIEEQNRFLAAKREGFSDWLEEAEKSLSLLEKAAKAFTPLKQHIAESFKTEPSLSNVFPNYKQEVKSEHHSWKPVSHYCSG